MTCLTLEILTSRGVRALTLLAVCLLAMATPARAQETVNLSSVSGRVLDPQGAVVPGAQVVARQTETNLTREAVTDQDGRFRLPYLSLGPYEITVRLSGFSGRDAPDDADDRIGVRGALHARG